MGRAYHRRVDARSGTRAVLARVIANRDLRRVLFSYFAFHIAEFGTWVAILLYAYEATGPASIGMVALLQLVPAASAAAPAMVVTRPTQSALLPSLSRTPDELTAANGAAGIVEGFGVLVGPLVAALVIAVSSAGGGLPLARGGRVGGAPA